MNTLTINILSYPVLTKEAITALSQADSILCTSSQLRLLFTEALKNKGLPTYTIPNSEPVVIPNEATHIDAFLFGYYTDPNIFRIVTPETEHLCRSHLRKNMVRVTPLVKLSYIPPDPHCAPLFHTTPIQYCVEVDLYNLYEGSGPAKQETRDLWISGFLSLFQQLTLRIDNISIPLPAISIVAQLEQRRSAPYKTLPCFVTDYESKIYTFSRMYNLVYGTLKASEFYLGGKIVRTLTKNVKEELTAQGAVFNEDPLTVLRTVCLDTTGMQIL